jgi:hypothetical protein
MLVPARTIEDTDMANPRPIIVAAIAVAAAVLLSLLITDVAAADLQAPLRSAAPVSSST